MKITQTGYAADFRRLYLTLFVVFLSFFPGIAFGQSREEPTKSEINCRLPESGEYIEIPTYKWDAPEGVHRTSWRITKARTEKDDEWWTPTGVDLVNPIYKLFIYREKRNGMPEGKCNEVAKTEGLLITPLGKVFRFKEATFDRRTLLLKFTTVRRNEWRYEGEFQFFSKPEPIRGGIFQAGTLTLKADAPDLGVVSMTFPVKWG